MRTLLAKASRHAAFSPLCGAIVLAWALTACASKCDLYCDSLATCAEADEEKKSGIRPSRSYSDFEDCVQTCDDDRASKALSDARFYCVIDAAGSCPTINSKCPDIADN